MNDIAVVIPCYNRAAALRRTLEALRNQTIQPQEIVVIDDASHDDPGRVVKEFEDRMPIGYTRLLHNHGAPFARNEGARLTSSPYLLFLDADAELIPEALEIFRNRLDEHPEIDFVYANFLWGQKTFRGQPFNLQALQKINFIHTSSMMRRSSFPGFDESLKKFQDWDLWLTMAKRGSKGEWIDRLLYRIEPHQQGMSHWLPACVHRLPWPIFGWMPDEIRSYRRAERILRTKHGI